MLEPVNIYNSLSRQIKSALYILFFAAFLVAVPFMLDAQKPPSTSLVASYCFLALLAVFGVIAAIWQFIDRRPALVLQNDGFAYSTFFFSRRTVPWSNVKGMRHVVTRYDSFVAVALHDESAYLAGLNWAQRINAKLASLVMKAPVTVPTVLLKDRQLVAELMEDYRKRALSGDISQAWRS